MLLQLLGLVCVFFITHTHYSSAKAAVITLFIGIASFVMYFFFNMIGVIILTAPVGLYNNLKSKNTKDLPSEPKRTISRLEAISAGKFEWRLPFCSLVSVSLLTLLFNLLHTSNFIRALFYTTFALYALLSYLDKVFTHLPNRFMPFVLEVSIYSFIAMSLFKIS